MTGSKGNTIKVGLGFYDVITTTDTSVVCDSMKQFDPVNCYTRWFETITHMNLTSVDNNHNYFNFTFVAFYK